MKKQKSVFLKVDGVEPVFGTCFPTSESSRMDGIKVWRIGNHGYFFPCDRYTVCDPDKAVEDGRRQVVELMNKLVKMTIADNRELFGYVTVRDILNHFSYDEIVARLDTWKKEKEIHVKDEVEHKEFGHTAVVIDIHKDVYGRDRLYAITKNKEFIADAPANDYAKTGLHVDDLDVYLEV